MKLQPAPTPELQRLRDARMLAYKRYWKSARANGYVALIRKRDGLRRLQEQVQTDLAHAQYPVEYVHPAPPMTGRNQPAPERMRGHPFDVMKPEDVRAWIDKDAFVREGHSPRMAADLAFLDTFKRK